MMSKIKELTMELNAEMDRVYAEYVDLHQSLRIHSSSVIDEPYMKEAERLIDGIQNKYAELYPLFHFVAHRYQFATNVTDTYNEWINDLIKIGAKESESTES